jgi:hypothetical protein
MMRTALLLACLSCIALAGQKPSPVEILTGARVSLIAYQRAPGQMKADHVLTAADDPGGYRAEVAKRLQSFGLDVVLVDDCASATTDLVVGVMLPPEKDSRPNGDFVIRRRGQKKAVFENGWMGRFDATLTIDTPLAADKLAEIRSDIIRKMTLADFWQQFEAMVKGHSRGSGQSRSVPSCF